MLYKDKDPNAKLDYTIDWDRATPESAPGTGWLGEGETIETSTWTVPDGLEEVTPEPTVVDGAKAVIWLAGGTLGARYRVVNHIVTSQGRDDDRSLGIYITEK